MHENLKLLNARLEDIFSAVSFSEMLKTEMV